MSKDIDKPYLTKNNFLVRFEETEKDMVMLSGYLWAVSTLMPEFKKIAETAQNFDDLKKQILHFANQNIELNTDIEEAKENDWDKYGFPPNYRGLDYY